MRPQAGVRIFWVLFVLLVAVRLPSLAQPAGADQALYAYVGQRILAGELPYRDAWDQKPPAVHYTYALLWLIWPDERVVAVADLVVTVLTALLVWRLGRRIGPPGSGEAAALVFLLLGNPALGRLGGVRVRAQCEVFIGLAAAAGFLLLHGSVISGVSRRAAWLAAAAGAAFGAAFLYKYNAGSVLAAAMAAGAWWVTERAPSERHSLRGWLALTVWMLAGFAASVASMLIVFAAGGALRELYHATITYNVFYSGETYEGRFALLRYLLTFPVRHARIDALWFLGGLGCAFLLASAVVTLFRGTRTSTGWRWPLRGIPDPMPLLWVAAACLSIAVNGSRGLPQYFVQAYPALALAFGVAAGSVWRLTRPRTRLLLVLAVAIAVQRVANFDKVADYTAWDVRAWTGSLTREAYLARFGGRDSGDKYSALAVHELAQYLRAHLPADETVLLFGFSPGALVQSARESATRFFWSRPLIVGFGEGWPGFGVRGLHDDLVRRRPALVVLQRRDWDPDTVDSFTFFMSRPELRGWLEYGYTHAGELGNFVIWKRKD
ncbi:MAG TPA: hypothetical protein VIL35_15415 [Vicinamibacterales bacterium]